MSELPQHDPSTPVGTPDQVSLARNLGVEFESVHTHSDLISQIEIKLGQDTMLEQARWFLMSVLRHGNKAKWQDVSESGITEERQYQFAQQYINADDLKQSLRTVLKDARCKFTLIRFAKARNISKLTLSTTTKAYKEALAQLKSANLINTPSRPVRKRMTQNKGSASGTTVNRRAARRGYFDEEDSGTAVEVEIHSPSPKREENSEMSEEEYAELEQVIEGQGERPPVQNWSYPTNEDRLSLLLGLAAGGGAFVIVLLLFL